MVVKRTVNRNELTPAPMTPGSPGHRPQQRVRAVATAGASRSQGALGPGCPRLCLTPRQTQTLTGVPVPRTSEEETQGAADLGAGGMEGGARRSGASGAPMGRSRQPGSFPQDTPPSGEQARGLRFARGSSLWLRRGRRAMTKGQKTDSCSLEANLLCQVFCLLFTFRKKYRKQVLSVLTEAQESLSNIPNAPLQSWDWTPRL